MLKTLDEYIATRPIGYKTKLKALVADLKSDYQWLISYMELHHDAAAMQELTKHLLHYVVPTHTQINDKFHELMAAT